MKDRDITPGDYLMAFVQSGALEPIDYLKWYLGSVSFEETLKLVKREKI